MSTAHRPLPDSMWARMPVSARIARVHVDIMQHPGFALLSGVVCLGKVEVTDEVPTAATDGRDVLYNEAFVQPLNQRQLRYLVLHENMHKALRHCVLYRDVVKKYPDLSNVAMDYVVNSTIEGIDRSFIERPVRDTLIDPQYEGMSFIEVLRKLLQDPPQGGAHAMDGHMDGTEEMDGEELKALERDVEDALRQGKMRADKLRGDTGGGNDLDVLIEARDTPWREALQDFIQSRCEGEDYSRINPPNKRFLPLGIVMWSHFSESVGELIIAGDTSASMTGVYPTVFGEIARICESVRPESVRVLWWDTKVRGDQEFKPDQYHEIAQLMKPKGGGGTTVSCVAQYVAQKEYKPAAVIYLTDGYIESQYDTVDAPCLWGVVDNERFMPLVGQKVNINSLTI